MEMKNRFQEAIQNVQRQRHLARRSVAMVLVLAMLTAMSVSWRLHQDGIALAADDTRYYCGKEEHKHTDDCYIEGTEPLCGYEEGEIVEEAMDSADDAGDGDSSAADWDEAGSEPESEPATQEEPEVVLHHHTSDCYEEKEVLTCGIESDHVHQDYCYDQETGELLCTEHEHTDDCYTLEEVLVCGQEEGEPEKTDDGAALYDMDENSAEESDFAGEPETVADPELEKEATKPETDDEIDTGYTVHHHTAECYGKVLICGKEEHEHTAACLVNPNAEIDAEYDAKTPDRTDADWAEDMVLVAQSQLGYTESKADVDEDGNGYTMYADQYYKDKPMVYADWDSTFVAYCLYHAGVPQDIIPQYASISALRGELARMNSEYYTDDPQGFASILPGDIVMYKNAEGRETIGVVSDAAVDEETDLTTALTVISGDVATGYKSDGETTIDQVAEVEVALNDVTSFVSVNAAEGYGVDDLMDDDVAVQDMTQDELLEALKSAVDFGQYIPKNGGLKISNTKFVSEPKESYRTEVTIHFEVPQDDAKGFTGDRYAYKIDLPKDFGLDPDWMNSLLGQDHTLLSGLKRIGNYRFVQKEDGTYAILLKFNQDYLKKNPLIEGNIKFWGEIGTEHGNKEGSVEIQFNDKIKLTIPKNEITYPADKTNAYDIKTTKSGSYDSKTHQLTYTVTVVSEKGTPGDVRFDDKIDKIEELEGLTLGEPTITVKKRTVTENRTNKDSGWSQAGSTEWETVNNHTLNVTGSGEIKGTLPKMETIVLENELERTHTEYEVTYVYKVSDMKNVNYQLENKVGVSSSTDTKLTIEDTDTAKVPLNNEYTITKTAGDYANGKIKWTITLNSNELDITNAVLKDTMVAGNTTIADVLAKASDITIDPNSGFEYIDADGAVTTDPSKRVGIKFTDIDGQPNHKKYTIVYYTSHEQSDNKYTVNNTATLKPDGSDAVTTGSIGKDVNPIFYTKKALPNEVKIEDGKMIIPWESSVDFSNTDKIEKGTRFYDSFLVAGAYKEHAMTPEQARAMTVEWVNSGGSSCGILDESSYHLTFIKEAATNDNGVTDGTEVSLGNPNEVIHGYKIEFIKDVPRPANATAVRVKYSSTVTASEMHEGDIFRNLFKINDFQRWERWNYIPSFPKITKMDGEDQTGTTTVESEDGTITWKIKIHTNGFLNGSVTIHDDLPTGVVVESVKRQGDNSVINITPGKEFRKNWNNDVLTGIYDQSNKTLEMTLSNERYLMRNTDYVFIIKCKAVSDPKNENAAIVPGKSYVYTNTASAWFGSNKDALIGESTQTQYWSEKDNTPVIKPIGKDVQTGNNGQTLNYTVTINPEGKKLLENSTEGLKIKDTLSVQVHPDYVNLNNDSTGDVNRVTVSAELDEKSVKLYYAVKNSSTDELESTGRQVEGCKMTLESYPDPEHPERMLYIIHLTDVPDDKPLILRYTYTLVSDIDVHYGSQWKSYGYLEAHGVQNTAELEGTSYKTKLEPTKTDYAYSGTSGNVMSTYFLTLKKVAKGNYTTLLPGAVFQLQKYENGTFSNVGNKTYTTDDSGTITIQQGRNDGDFKFDTNTLYCLVETKSPEGYALSQTPVYFYFKDDNDSGHKLPTIEEEEMDQAVDLNSQSKQVYVENEPNLTSVTVEKKWQNSDGTKLDNPPSSIDFELVQLVSSTPPSSSSATVKESKTYTLTAANNWRMVIENLPRSNSDRTEYYSYKIVETTSMDGYKVTYSTESGVVGGYLVMVNTKQEEPTYELPSTGSPGGTVPYTVGGAAIALAAVLCGYNSRRKRKRGEE